MASVILPFAEEVNHREWDVANSTKDVRLISTLITPYKNGAYVEKRPGWQTVLTPSSGNYGEFIFQSAGVIYSVFTDAAGGTRVLYSGTTSRGNLGTTVVTGLSRIDIGGVKYILISSDADSWYFNTNTNTLTQITDADFPASIRGHFVALDGYNFVLSSDGKIYNSDLNSIANWSATSYISTNLSTDNGSALALYKNYVVAFGEASMEVFYDAGNPTGSPLARYDQAYSRIGVQHIGGSESAVLAQLGDIICWVGSYNGSQYQIGIYTLNNLRPEKLSTPWIDRVLTGNNAQLSLFVFNGQIYLCVNVHAQGSPILNSLLSSWLFCFDTKTWVESGFPYNFLINSDYDSPMAVAMNNTGGRIFEFANDSPAWRDEVSTSYTMTIQMDKWDAGTNKRKFLDRIDLIGSDIQSSGTTTLEISVDDYASWTTLGTFDNTVINPYLVNCGSFVGGAAFRVTHSANTPWRAKGLKIYYRTGQQSLEQNG